MSADGRNSRSFCVGARRLSLGGEERLLPPYQGHKAPVTAILCDGPNLFSGSHRGEVRQWTRDGACQYMFTGVHLHGTVVALAHCTFLQHRATLKPSLPLPL